MTWIYLSPHLDDVALSCGGLLWQQAQAGQDVSLWTLCAGDPPDAPLSPFAASLHARWETGLEAVQRRRVEDLVSCARLGAAARHFSVPDCIYRRHPQTGEPLYPSEESLFGALHPAESGQVQALSAELARLLPPDAQVVCPLTLGHHVDHQLVRAAAELLHRPLWYFPDFPYTLQAGPLLDQMRRQGWLPQTFPISEQGLQAWIASVAAHASQISTFWNSLDEMQTAIRAYSRAMGGVVLWHRPE